MQRVNNIQELKYYIDKFNIKDIFENDMEKYMELHSFDKGEQIYKTNKTAEYLYFLVKGKFKVLMAQQNGKSLLIRFYQPFQMIGDVELLLDSDPLCNLEVLNEVVCIGISIEVIRNKCMKDIKFLNYISRNVAQKLMESSSSSSINLLYPLENRLASYLLAISPEDETSKNIVGIATNKLTEIADFLGTSYRHLNRTIAMFQSKNLIKKEKTFIEIINRKELEKLAGDLYR